MNSLYLLYFSIFTSTKNTCAYTKLCFRFCATNLDTKYENTLQCSNEKQFNSLSKNKHKLADCDEMLYVLKQQLVGDVNIIHEFSFLNILSGYYIVRFSIICWCMDEGVKPVNKSF